jgi:magnesium chelatase family protein
MWAKVLGAAVVGVDGQVVEVECDISPGLPAFDTVGLAELAVREARVRVRSAIRMAGLAFPRTRVTVNLAPADLRKDGTSFDLPVALALLTAYGTLTTEQTQGWMALAELSLGGDLRPVTGVLPVAELCKARGLRGLLCAPDNAAEALAVGGVDVRVASTLAELVACLRGQSPWPALPEPAAPPPQLHRLCWSDVRGHAQAKRALEVAAAGGHNAVLVGTPGCGKTMLARRLPTILPALTPAEAVEVSKVHSVAGLLPLRAGLLAERPFRAPHHTASASALVGGGSMPKPGEVSLAHRGVLFLDELAEFPRMVLETLRQPLEDGEVTVTRARLAVRFPARLMLVAALNPCPCGHAGSTVRPCTCSPQALERYQARLSGPLLDRIDIQLHVPPVSPAALRYAPPSETSAMVRERVEAARLRQELRFADLAERTNASVAMQELKRRCPLADDVHDLLLAALTRLGLSPRAHDRVWRVAQTLADLDQAAAIGPHHIAEALQFRHFDEQRAQAWTRSSPHPVGA